MHFANAIRSYFGVGIGMSDVVVAVGSTPTCSILPEHLNDVDAIHPGNYLYYDIMQADLGSCKEEDNCSSRANTRHWKVSKTKYAAY